MATERGNAQHTESLSYRTGAGSRQGWRKSTDYQWIGDPPDGALPPPPHRRNRSWAGFSRVIRTQLSALPRWLFLILTFLYLFTLALALFQADAFQVLVGQLAVAEDDPRAKAGNARIREVLSTVRMLDGAQSDRRALEAAKLERCDSTLNRWGGLKRKVERCDARAEKDSSARKDSSAKEDSPAKESAFQLPKPIHDWRCDGLRERLAGARRILTDCGYQSTKPLAGQQAPAGAIEDWTKPSTTDLAPTATARKGLPEVQQFVAGRVDELDALIRSLQQIDQSKLTLTVAAGAEIDASERDHFNEMLVGLKTTIAGLGAELTDGPARRGLCTPLNQAWPPSAGAEAGSETMDPACLSVATLMQLQEVFSRLSGYRLQPTIADSAGLSQPLANAVGADVISFERDLDRISNTLPALYALLPKFHCTLNAPFVEIERVWNAAPATARQSGLPLFSAEDPQTPTEIGARVQDFFDSALADTGEEPTDLNSFWTTFLKTTTQGAPDGTVAVLDATGLDALRRATDDCVQITVAEQASETGPVLLIEPGGGRAELPDRALAREFARLDEALGRLSNLAANQVGYQITHQAGASSDATPSTPAQAPEATPAAPNDQGLVELRDRLAAREAALTSPPLGRLGTRRDGVADLRAALVGLGQGLPAPAEGQADVYDAVLIDAVASFQRGQTLNPDAVVGTRTLDALLAALDERIGTRAAPAPAGEPPTQDGDTTAAGAVDAADAFQAAVGALGKALDQVRRKLDQGGDDIRQASGLAVPVVEMASAAHALERIRVRTAPDAAAPAEEQRTEEQRQKAAEAELREATRRLRQVKQQIQRAIALDERADSDALVIYMISQVLGSGNRANDSAETIWSEYQSLGRFQSVLTPLAIVRGAGGRHSCTLQDGWWQRFWCQAMGFGFNAKHLGAMPRANLDLMVVFVLGAIGSFIYITQYQVKHILQGRGMSGGGATRYFAWYVFRPVFGIAIAFAIFLLYKTGAAALGSGSESILTADVNLPMLALISLFAGLLSWQALSAIQTRGERWMDAQKRKPLYATGLEAGLRNTGHSASELAAQIGRTPTQIERWISGRDMVTPEMQDRITTWLELSRTSLFSDEPLDEAAGGRMLWATGLARALDTGDRVMDVDALAALLERDRSTVEAWKELRRQVDPDAQLAIAEILDMRPADLFDETRPDAEWWAHNLRKALENDKVPYATAEELAEVIGDNTARVRRWMELQEPVPKPMRDAICKAIGVPHSQLFGSHPPRGEDFRWATKLRETMQTSSLGRAGDLARAVDADPVLVRAWMEMEICEGEVKPPFCGQVAPATQARIARVLGVSEEVIFRTERAADDFRWPVNPEFRLRVEERGGVRAFAERIDVDRARVQRWIDGEEPIAPDTRQRIKQEFELAADDDSLFERHEADTAPKRLEGQWWATHLSDALAGTDDEHPAALIPELARRIGCEVDELRGYVELRAPTPTRIRRALVRELNLPHDSLFGQHPPARGEFDWAPGLRVQMAKGGLDADDLALRADLDPVRVRQWMEMDERIAPWADQLGADQAGFEVRLGQVAPSLRRRLAEALGCPERDLFDRSRPDQDARWVVKPTFRVAVEQATGGRAAFLRDLDLDADRLERWLSWDEPACEATWQAVNRYFGLPETSSQLFDVEQRTVDAIG